MALLKIPIEQELLNVKIKIIDQLSNSKYQVSLPKDFNPNFILIKGNGGFNNHPLVREHSGNIRTHEVFIILEYERGLYSGVFC